MIEIDEKGFRIKRKRELERWENEIKVYNIKNLQYRRKHTRSYNFSLSNVTVIYKPNSNTVTLVNEKLQHRCYITITCLLGGKENVKEWRKRKSVKKS